MHRHLFPTISSCHKSKKQKVHLSKKSARVESPPSDKQKNARTRTLSFQPHATPCVSTYQNNSVHIFVSPRSNQGQRRRLGIEYKHADSERRIAVACRANTIARNIKKNTWSHQQKPPVCIWHCSNDWDGDKGGGNGEVEQKRENTVGEERGHARNNEGNRNERNKLLLPLRFGTSSLFTRDNNESQISSEGFRKTLARPKPVFIREHSPREVILR